jgi:hypothetical protein
MAALWDVQLVALKADGLVHSKVETKVHRRASLMVALKDKKMDA